MSPVLTPLVESGIVQESVNVHVVTCFLDYMGKILVLQRGRRDQQFGMWGIPGGKMDEGESPREALSREIFEETGIIIPNTSFQFLDRALSENRCDGSYILSLYYMKLNHSPSVLINTKEHLSYRWVTLPEFEKLNLLISQGLAYKFVSYKVKTRMGLTNGK